MNKGIEYGIALQEREEEMVLFRHHGVRVPPRLIDGEWVQDGMIPAYMDPGPQIGERWATTVSAITSFVMIIGGILWTLLS